MAETQTKSTMGQDSEKAQEKKRQLEPASLPVKAVADESISFPGLLGISVMELPLERHASLLGDPRFSHSANNVKKARMVTELQQNYGNAYVRNVVDKAQARFSTSSPLDAYGQDAGVGAWQVVDTPTLSAQTHPEKQVQRLAQGAEETTPHKGALKRIESRRGAGEPLASNVRSQMESAFGYDFSHVRIHTDTESDRLSRQLGTKAFTIGHDIFLGADAGKVGKTTGQTSHLASEGHAAQAGLEPLVLGHELAHVVQQTSSGGVGSPEEILESEATKAGREVSVGRPAHVSHAATSGQAQGFIETSLMEAMIPKLAETEPTTVRSVLEENDGDLVCLLSKRQISEASKGDKLKLIRLVEGLGWVRDVHEYKLEEIWGTFPRLELEEILENKDNFELWKSCVNKGADLDEIPVAEDIKLAFEWDVKATAQKYLEDNRTYALKELERIGAEKVWKAVVSFVAPPPVTAEETQRLRQLQEAASNVQAVQQAQRALRQIPVGYRSVMQKRGPYDFEPVLWTAYFDPDTKPDMGPRGNEQPSWVSWEVVKKQYDDLQAIIADYTTRYPAIYGLIRDNRIDELVKASDARQAQSIVATTLCNLLNNISEARGKIRTDDVDYRDLRPIHQQLFQGMAPIPISVDWSKPLGKWVAEGVIEGHENAQFWTSLGLGTLAAALFVVAGLTTGGIATAFFVVGAGVSAIQPVISWERTLDLAQASEATLSGELALVSEEQARAALIEAVLDSAFALLDLYGAVKGVATAVRAGRVPVIKEALIAGEKLAREAIPTAIDIATPNAREMVSRAVAELGVEEAQRRTGKSLDDLLKLVGEDSAAGKTIMTYQKRAVTLAEVPTVSILELPEQLGKLTALGKEMADKVVLDSIKQFGAKRTIEMAGGWEELVKALGKETAAGEQLEAWRSLLFADLEKYVRETLGGDLRRTGTWGFTSDLDITLLGDAAAANRDKAMSFLAGRAGTSPGKLKQILHCDMFTDPRRMHLYDILPDELREKYAKETAKFEEGLLWNRRLFEAEKMGDQSLVDDILQQMTDLGIPKKAYTPLKRADIASLNKEIDDLIKLLTQAKEAGNVSKQIELVTQIGQRQAMINAAEGGGYFTAGGVRRFVTERAGEELPIPGLREGLGALPAERVGAVLDQLAKLDKEYMKLLDELPGLMAGAPDVGKLAEALKSVGKYGERLTSVVREGFGETIQALPDFDDMARAFEGLIKQAREGTLQPALLTDRANVLVGKATQALNQVEQSSTTLLHLLREHAELGAATGAFAKIQRMTILHVRWLRAKDVLARHLPILVGKYIKAEEFHGE